MRCWRRPGSRTLWATRRGAHGTGCGRALGTRNLEREPAAKWSRQSTTTRALNRSGTTLGQPRGGQRDDVIELGVELRLILFAQMNRPPASRSALICWALSSAAIRPGGHSHCRTRARHCAWSDRRSGSNRYLFASPITTACVARVPGFSSTSGYDFGSQTRIRIPIVRIAIAALGSKPVTDIPPQSKRTREIAGLLE